MQVLVTSLNETQSFLFRGLAVEVHQIVYAGEEHSGKQARIEIRPSRGIEALPLISPAKIALVLRADQSRDVPWMPASSKHHSDDALHTARPEEEVIGLFKNEPCARGQVVQRGAIVSVGPKGWCVVLLGVKLFVKAGERRRFVRSD